MDLDQALAVLGLRRDADASSARAAYRRLVRQHHPDTSGADRATSTARTAELTAAYAVVRAAIASGGTSGASPRPPSATEAAPPAHAPASVWAVADDTLAIEAPADEAWAMLHEAGSLVGHIAYVDARLGILEVIVRFEGGPSCSVLITLQGRAEHTEAFCTMASIEGADTPSIAPVMEALLAATTEVASGPRPG